MNEDQIKFITDMDKEFHEKYSYRDMLDEKKCEEMIMWIGVLTEKVNGNETVREWFLEVLKEYEAKAKLIIRG